MEQMALRRLSGDTLIRLGGDEPDHRLVVGAFGHNLAVGLELGQGCKEVVTIAA